MNPTGVVGTWLNGDAFIPSGDFDGFADGSFLVALSAPRMLHTATVVAGEDGIQNTFDDRIIVSGGGSTFFPDYGGEPASISTEIYLPPGANNE